LLVVGSMLGGCEALRTPQASCSWLLLPPWASLQARVERTRQRITVQLRSGHASCGRMACTPRSARLPGPARCTAGGVGWRGLAGASQAAAVLACRLAAGWHARTTQPGLRAHRPAKLEVALRNAGLPPADGTTLCSRARAGPAQDCVDARAIVIAMRAQQRPDRPRPRLHATHRQSGAPPEPPVSQRARLGAGVTWRSGARRCAGPALPEMMARVTRIELWVTAAVWLPAVWPSCCPVTSRHADGRFATGEQASLLLGARATTPANLPHGCPGAHTQQFTQRVWHMQSPAGGWQPPGRACT
jgi:hypothetical protein